MIVLDTHAWVWWAGDRRRLSEAALAAVVADAERGVCAVSCWEVAMFVAKGRLSLDRDVADWVHDALGAPGIVPLDLTPANALAAGLLKDLPGDPADRMIAATALGLGIALVTKDRRLRAYRRLRTVW